MPCFFSRITAFSFVPISRIYILPCIFRIFVRRRTPPRVFGRWWLKEKEMKSKNKFSQTKRIEKRKREKQTLHSLHSPLPPSPPSTLFFPPNPRSAVSFRDSSSTGKGFCFPLKDKMRRWRERRVFFPPLFPASPHFLSQNLFLFSSTRLQKVKSMDRRTPLLPASLVLVLLLLVSVSSAEAEEAAVAARNDNNSSSSSPPLPLQPSPYSPCEEMALARMKATLKERGPGAVLSANELRSVSDDLRGCHGGGGGGGGEEKVGGGGGGL